MATDSKEKVKNLEQALQQIEKQFGKGAIMKFGETEVQKVEAIPTGCLTLDIALGIGGIPRGRIIEIYGPESSGKTTVALHMIAETQKQGVCTQMENELLLERLIQARGFRDVIVTLSDKNCTVVVADDNLEAQEVAQILSVVTNETSYTANDVIVCQY